MSLPGYATPEGTLRYQQRFASQVANGHFRETLDQLHLTSLGMGTYLGVPDEANSLDMTNAAVRSVTSGTINVLDTAINYRHQLSERALAQALRHLTQKHDVKRDEVFVCTKNGFLSPDAESHVSTEEFRNWFRTRYIESGWIQPQDIAGGMHCMAPLYLKDQIDQSRENLGVETIDLLYRHNAVESQMPTIGREGFMDRLTQAFEALEESRAAGTIRYYGLATWNCFRTTQDDEAEYMNLQTVVRLAETVGGTNHGFRFIQLPFNLAFPEALTLTEQRVDDEPMSLLEAAMALGIGVFTSVPLLQGQLLKESLPHFDGIETPAQTCLQFARSQPGILAPLVGHKATSHVEENIRVANVAPVSMESFETLLAQKG